MPETPDSMPDGTPAIRPIEKATAYLVHVCTGFATSFTVAGDDRTFQFSFWMDDITPVNEDIRKPVSDIGHFDSSLKHVFQTAVQLNPNVAMQLALNILQNIANMPENVKDRYGVPRKITVQQEADP